MMPVAGTKMIPDQAINGVCNGAFQDHEYTEHWSAMKKHENLDVEDIAHDSSRRAKSVIQRNQYENRQGSSGSKGLQQKLDSYRNQSQMDHQSETRTQRDISNS